MTKTVKFKLPFFTLLLLISFASVNAVLFTPALPDIAHFFHITEDRAQLTISWCLVGYALGQLLYGPIANRFGRKPALFFGIGLQIASSLLCVFSGVMHSFGVLILGRFLMALGSGVGLKMTFTLVNECYEPSVANQKISYLMLAFAVTPGLGVALGGVLNTYWGWMSAFYACAVYGLLLFVLVRQLPETQKELQLHAFDINHLIQNYWLQFTNRRLVISALLMGASTTFIYIFAAISPFIAMRVYGMTSDMYGMANCLPPIGLIFGSWASANLAKRYCFEKSIRIGISIASLGGLLMLFALWMNCDWLFALFLPMIIIYFGLCFILANASSLAMSHVTDKAHGAAAMSFINMGSATMVVFAVSLFTIRADLLPLIYLVLSLGMFGLLQWLQSAFPAVTTDTI